jgi:putative transcriptional regulator
MKKKRTGPLPNALLEAAGDMRKSGILAAAADEKITMRHLGRANLPKVSPVTADQIRTMRARARG